MGKSSVFNFSFFRIGSEVIFNSDIFWQMKPNPWVFKIGTFFRYDISPNQNFEPLLVFLGLLFTFLVFWLRKSYLFIRYGLVKMYLWISKKVLSESFQIFLNIFRTHLEITKITSYSVWHSKTFFCPALTKLALDLHVNFCGSVCLFVCLSGLFFKASNWMIYWLLTVVLATYLSE